MRNDPGGASDDRLDAYGADDRHADALDAARAEEGQVSAEAESQGRDVRDISRGGVEHGVDVLSDENPAEIENTGRTVVDRSRIAETRGADVIDLGPVDEPLDDTTEP